MRPANFRKLVLAGLALLVIAGCESSGPRKSDAELGLNPQQARGRKVYDTYCLNCHEPYSHGGRRGPSLMGLFKKPDLPSGAPANDQRVTEAILQGRMKMPGFAGRIDQQQLDDLLAYLHTL